MPISDRDIARIRADVENVVRSLHAAHLARGEGTLEQFLMYFDDDVIGIGTGKDEVVFNKKDLTTFLEREWGEVATSLHYELHSIDVRVLSAESASAQSFVDIYLGQSGGDSLHARLTTVFRNVDGEWRGVHWHASTPWEIQPEGVSWPTDELEARARKLQQQVDARTQELAKANRELEIDAALERIRRVTGEMKDPSDLVEVVKQIKVDVDSLFGSSIVEVGLVQEADSETLRFWSIFDAAEVPEDLTQFGLLYPKKPDPFHPMVVRVWAVEEGYANLFFDLDAMWQIHRSLAHYNPPEADLLKAALDGGMQGGWVTVCAVQVGRMYLSWSAEPPEEVASAQPRIAAVLTEAQQRVEELRHAQQLAREAEINLAVEKVRARATGMQSPDDLTLVMKQLKMEVDRLWGGAVQELSISQHHDEDQLRFWVILDADNVPDSLEEFGQFFPKRPDPPHPTVERALQQTESFSKSHIHREELLANIKSLEYHFPHYAKTTRPLVESAKVLELWYTSTPIHDGWIAMAWGDDPPSEVESIQRRLADVLDEALRRVDELRKAQHMAREAEINLAVEKVRARASGMQTSGEIVDVADVLREQLVQLGLSDVMACTVYTRTPSGKHRVSEMARLEEGSTQFSFDWIFDPVDLNPQVMVHNFLAAETTTVFHEDAEAMALLMKEALKYDPDYTEEYQEAKDQSQISEIWVTVCPSESIRLCIDFKTEPPEEILSILPRMAQAFDHAYRRHQDLERVEAQAQAALIEVALERIRGRAMAMRTSSELSDVVSEMRHQMAALGQKDLEVGMVHLYDLDEDDFESWGAMRNTDGGELMIGSASMPKKGVPILEECIALYESSQSDYTLVNEGIRAAEFMHMLSERAPAQHDAILKMAGGNFSQMRAYWTFSDFQGGSMGMVTYQPPEPESVGLLKRTAQVLNLAYRRFKDLREAEEAEREAQIEAALERVRGRAMAMQKPEDIGATCRAMFDEIRGLCPDILRLGLAVGIDEENLQPWLVGKDSAGQPRIYEGRMLKRGEREEVDALFGAWQEKRVHWFKESRGFLEWAQTVFAGTNAEGVITVETDRDQYFSAFTHQTGFLYAIAFHPYGLDREEGRVINRFGGVFDLAYQRFNDLKQAAIDYKALLAEKARTEQALSDLQATQKQLIEQEKLASLGSLTAGIAHEIKNPLNFVNNFAEVSRELVDELFEALGMGQDGDVTGADGANAKEARAIMDDLRANAEQIAKHGGRADAIVRSMMQHARGGTAERETVDVNAFVAEYIDLAWHGMRAKDHTFDCEVERALAPGAGEAVLQPQDMGRVLLNLLNNAFYATQMEDAAPDARVRVATSREDDRIVITVADNGPGIPEDIRPKIFEPFFTTKPTGEGTGLGLSLSHDIVTKGHGGTLTVETDAGSGAVFIVSIPAQ